MGAALVLVAHGSRDADWARPLRDIEARVRALRPDLDVGLGFLELSSPAAEELVRVAARSGAASVYLAPLFLGQGTHGRRDMIDLTARLRVEHPNLKIELIPAVGEFESVLDAIAGALSAAVR
jgi:sirohydrochlorin cobaltochelatase